MTGMAFVKTWEQLAACRVILGVFEAGFFPAVRAIVLAARLLLTPLPSVHFPHLLLVHTLPNSVSIGCLLPH